MRSSLLGSRSGSSPAVLRTCALLALAAALALLHGAGAEASTSWTGVGLAAGGAHTCALTSAGGVRCWGENQFGQIGDGTTATRKTPVAVSGLSSGTHALATGFGHTCALTSAGGVKCWGLNTSGQLGDGSTTNRTTPVDVSGLQSEVTALAAGYAHTCALTAAGGVKCWGDNDAGELGDGSTTNRTTPVDVSGLQSGVTALLTGGAHTCALTDAGGVKCWGSNAAGQLGDGSTTNRTTPVGVSGLSSGVTALAAGYAHTCAVGSAGEAKCWGLNSSGQLGDGSTTNRTTPVGVSGLQSGVSVLAGGYGHTCALTSGGGVKCWGSNNGGQLGDGSTTNRTAPVEVFGLQSGVTAPATGFGHTCAIATGGRVKCWGANSSGQLGDGTTVNSTTPVDVTEVQARLLAAGNDHTCALMHGGGLKCWGGNGSGQLGDGSTAQRFSPTDVSGLQTGVTVVAAGYAHTCAAAAGVKCWGANTYGQLGDGSLTNRSTPTDVSGLQGAVDALAAGSSHTCALTDAGGLKCWGGNWAGQLGIGAASDGAKTPVDVPGLQGGVAAVAAGSAHTCALTSAGGVKCWGDNGGGQLGDGTTTRRPAPVDVAGLQSGVVAIVAGSAHTCALTSEGGVKCWGLNSSGQLGDGSSTNRTTPVAVSGLQSGVTSLAAGYAHTCALTDAGGVKCWGSNGSGQLGTGRLGDGLPARRVPVDVSGLQSGVIALGAGFGHTCAVTSESGLECWGSNGSGQLGDGTLTASWRPLTVSFDGVAPERPTGIAAGNEFTCALMSSSWPRCWGYNADGRVTSPIPGYPGPYKTPVSVTAYGSLGWPLTGVVAIASGDRHSCALRTTGGVSCWGANGSGQLGRSFNDRWGNNWEDVGGLYGITALAAGSSHTCTLTGEGGVKCWGGNGSGQLGDGTTVSRSSPRPVSGLSTGVTAIAAGRLHTCALTTAGGVKCWGANGSGQLGDGTRTSRSTPVEVTGLQSGVTAVAASGDDHTCALTSAGGVKCWGRNSAGQLGDGSTVDRPAPVDVSGLQSGVSAIAVGGDDVLGHTCALTTGGGAKCWGSNYKGGLGDGTRTDRSTPVDVAGLQSGIVALALGVWHSCVVTSAGGAKCWGSNSWGELGDGTVAEARLTPVDVVFRKGLGGGRSCLVPKVVGKKVPAAKRAIKGAGCAVGKIKRRYSAKPRGRVVAQSPKPKQARAFGAKVNFVVSKGRKALRR